VGVIAKSEQEDLFLEMSTADDFVGHMTDFAIRGISFTSRKRGWAFDNVKNFEVSLKFVLRLIWNLSRLYSWKSPKPQVKRDNFCRREFPTRQGQPGRG
jgi:hypothetical protein